MRVDPPHTMVELLDRRTSTTPSLLAFQYRLGERWIDLDWAGLDEASRQVAAGLVDCGVQIGDRVAILSRTRLEWVIAMLAIWRAGAVVVTVYPSSTPDEVRFLLEDAGCVALFVEDETSLARVAPALEALPALQTVIGVDARQDGCIPWEALRAGGRARLQSDGATLARIAAHLTPDHLAALIYTSGTTGRPKGVMLSHDNFVAVCLGTEQHTPIDPVDKQYLFLPLAHVYGMVVALVAIHVGVPSVIDGDIERIAQGLAQTRPTFMPAVPRVFEKIHERALDRARRAGTRRFAVFSWAVDVGRRWSRTVRAGRPVPPLLAIQHRVADRLVFRRVRDGLGGRIRAFTSGGAPLAVELAEFFHAVGMPVLEGYGMTESTAITCSNRFEDWRLGTVGQPGDGIEVRVADDGELLIRGRTVMKGYWGLPEETAETLRDGWLHTGDVAEIDADGRIRITDRKKHLIITSGGKNIAPAKVENRLKAASDLIGEVLMHGDRRKFCVALVALDPDALAAFADRAGLRGDHATLSRHPTVRAVVDEAVQRVNATLASYETLKAVHVLEHMPSVESGELTPSLKLRRKVLETRYADVLDAFYA